VPVGRLGGAAGTVTRLIGAAVVFLVAGLFVCFVTFFFFIGGLIAIAVSFVHGTTFDGLIVKDERFP